ncbi:MAG: hypothetical protein K1X67_12320 [Fimbriimonadaceae bacterium]|nr:hypothetical protein [Fimbriimonadaceae bacterium]
MSSPRLQQHAFNFLDHVRRAAPFDQMETKMDKVFGSEASNLADVVLGAPQDAGEVPLGRGDAPLD